MYKSSSRKASIKEFHQFALLTVTIPLRMTFNSLSFRQSFHGEATRNLTSKTKTLVNIRHQKKRFSRRFAPQNDRCMSILMVLATMNVSEFMADLPVISNGPATMNVSELMADLNRGFAR